MPLLRRVLPLAAPLAALLAAAPARGAEPAASATPPGPDHGKAVTEDATPVGPRVLELEAAYTPSLTHRGSDGFDRAADAHSHGVSLKAVYGVTADVDLRIGGGFLWAVDRSDPAGPTRGSGPGDLALGARWRFLADAARALDLAVVATVVAPTGAEATGDALGVTQGYWSLRGALVASKDWGRTTGNVELAVTAPVSGDAGTLDGAGCANVALGYAFLPWLQPFAEASYDLARDAATQQRLALTAGLNLSSAAGTRLLVGVQHAVWGRNVTQDTAAVAAAKVAF